MAVDLSIFNRNWMINGVPINQGTRAQGLAVNARMIQAAIHDYNAGTQSIWAYPDTGVWSATRNNDEFCDIGMPLYADKGMNMATVGLMGGHPRFQCNQSGFAARDFVAYTKPGAMRADFQTRVENIIAKADSLGMFISVQLFYQNPAGGQLNDNAAYLTALENAVTWLRDLPYNNIVIELANEVSDGNYLEASVLQPANIPARLDDIHDIWPTAKATVCMSGGAIPSSAVLQRCDWISFHANQHTTTEMRSRIRDFCSQTTNKPIVVTEDPAGATDFNAAIDAGGGWGYYDQGCDSGSYTGAAVYRDGFQSPPVNWRINTTKKQAVFNAFAAATGH